MSVHYLPGAEALRRRSDFEMPPPGRGRLPRIRNTFLTASLFVGGTFALTGLIYAPVLITKLRRVDALEIAGRHVSAAMFADDLLSLFWGAFILALAVTSFVAGAVLSVSGSFIRPHRRPLPWEDPRRHPAVLRLIGPER